MHGRTSAVSEPDALADLWASDSLVPWAVGTERCSSASVQSASQAGSYDADVTAEEPLSAPAACTDTLAP